VTDGELDGFLLILYPALLMVVRWVEGKYGKRSDTQHSELGEFMLVVRRAMMQVTDWIAKREGLT
jgi:hypothetical protein